MAAGPGGLRPVELGPFDYENEVYSKSLWFAEGVTDYYADLQVHRAGLSNRDEYLQALSSQIASVQSTPGRLVQPLETASFDAWIKFYRSDENTANSCMEERFEGHVDTTAVAGEHDVCRSDTIHDSRELVEASEPFVGDDAILRPGAIDHADHHAASAPRLDFFNQHRGRGTAADDQD